MRQGNNPARDNPRLVEGYFAHRVIVPVYIPALDGYFEHMQEILRLCLDSLIATAGQDAGITVVGNGCCSEIVDDLCAYHRRGSIDQLQINARNHGKVSAVVSVAKGCYERLISVADCDVLFKPGWLQTMTKLFHDFPECGFAAMSPNPRHAWNNTSATILAAMLRRELRFSKLVSDEDLDQFASSVGQPDFFSEAHRRRQLAVRRNGSVACVGGGHFAFTIRREMLQRVPDGPTLTFHAAEGPYLDQPPDRLGAWRLSPTTACAWHMGNIPEPWMHERLKDIERWRATEGPTAPLPEVPAFRRSWAAYCSRGIRLPLVRFVRRLLSPARSSNTLWHGSERGLNFAEND